MSTFRCSRCHVPVPEDRFALPRTFIWHIWLHAFVCRFFFRDEYAKAWVLNWARDYFAIGFTTSPTTNGHLIGLWAADNAQKRQEQPDGSHHKAFRGVLIQAAFWWFKFYLYLYFDGDGRKYLPDYQSENEAMRQMKGVLCYSTWKRLRCLWHGGHVWAKAPDGLSNEYCFWCFKRR